MGACRVERAHDEADVRVAATLDLGAKGTPCHPQRIPARESTTTL